MSSRVTACGAALALIAGLVLGAAPAAGDEPKPLRTLVYEVAYTIQSSRDLHVSGLTGGDQHATESGRAAVQRGFTSLDRGTLQIDVVAAPLDGTLVVDASYTGHESRHPPIRVVIYRDGALSYDPKYTLSAQARRILPLLARGVLAERDISPGSTWSTPLAKPAAGTTTYRISHRRENLATLVIAADFTVPGPSGFEEHDDATTDYATDVLCPVTYDGRFRVRRQVGPEQLESSDLRVTARLVTDTFPKKR